MGSRTPAFEHGQLLAKSVNFKAKVVA